MPAPTPSPPASPDATCPLPSPPLNRWERLLPRFSLWIFVLIVLVESFTLFFTRTEAYPYGAISGSDGQCYYAFVRSLWIDRDLNFENEFREFNYLGHGRDTLLGFPRSPHTGRLFNRYPIGFPIFHAPFFFVANTATQIGNRIGIWTIEANGYSLPYQFAVLLGAVFWGACAFESTRRLLAHCFSPPLAALATLLYFLAFQGIFPIIQFPCNPHLQSLFIFNLILILGFRIENREDTVRTWMALGFLMGVLTLLRTECALVLSYFLPLFSWKIIQAKKDPSSRPAPRRFSPIGYGIAFAGMFAVAFFPQILAWFLMWGKWFHLEMTNQSEGFNWAHPVLGSVLFSTRRGLFYWTPVAFLGLWGFFLFLFSPRAGIALRGACVPLFILYYMYAAWKIWWMGYSFGARQFILLSGLFAVGLGFLLERFRKQRPLLIGISLLLIFWNHVMMYFFLNGHVSRTDAFHPLLPLFKFLELSRRLFNL